MQSIVVLTYEQIASLSEEELLDFARQKAAALIPTEPESPDAPKPYFFIRTKSGKVDLKSPPKVQVIISTRRV
jgi:hypothetical protein